MARILIVDDERSIRTTLAEFIREDGHEVFTAEDATQALALLEEKQPAVVVTDIILPRMTGVSLLKRINEIAPDIQVLMI
ncbi:response regulator, partial [Candidatus Bipolaricaulota bacterium]|nr:response regulator [Candidatus Bipolaricaulota bacterium]